MYNSTFKYIIIEGQPTKAVMWLDWGVNADRNKRRS